MLISGSIIGLTSTPTVTVKIDDADSGTDANHTFTITPNGSGAWTTASTDLTAARVQAFAEGAGTVTVSATGVTDVTRPFVYDATVPTGTLQSVSGGYVDGAEDDGDVGVFMAGDEVLGSSSFSITDGTDTLTKSGKRSVAYREKLDNAMSALTLANNDEFGTSVARDGQWLAVGAPRDGNKGVVYLIEDSDGDGLWADATSNDVIEINSDTAGITLTNDVYFGTGVALEGGLLAVGVPFLGAGGTVYLIKDGSNGWADIEAVDVTKVDTGHAGLSLSSGDRFGHSVALDGGVLAVGAFRDDTCPNSGDIDCGAVYLIENGANGWADVVAADVTKINHSSTLGITLASSDYFGVSVALEGEVLAVGASQDGTGGNYRGAVYILNDINGDGDYKDAGEQVKLSSSTNGITLSNGERFGTSVALEGDFMAVGVTGKSGEKGAVYLLSDGGDGWRSVVAADVTLVDDRLDGVTLGIGNRFGRSVALYNGALTVGANRVGTGKGRVYMFDPVTEATLATGDFEKGTPASNKLAEGTITVTADTD